MKKILILILAFVCLFLISCGDTQGDFTDNSDKESKTESTLPTSKSTEEEEISIDSMAKSVRGESESQEGKESSAEKQTQVRENDENKEKEENEIKNEFILTGIVKAKGEHLEIEVINSDYAFGIYWVLTFDETEFLNKSGEKITKNDISIGDMVEITYGGQTMLSYPPQIVAQRVKITDN